MLTIMLFTDKAIDNLTIIQFVKNKLTNKIASYTWKHAGLGGGGSVD